MTDSCIDDHKKVNYRYVEKTKKWTCFFRGFTVNSLALIEVYSTTCMKTYSVPSLPYSMRPKQIFSEQMNKFLRVQTSSDADTGRVKLNTWQRDTDNDRQTEARERIEARFRDGIRKPTEEWGEVQKNNGQRHSLLWPLQTSNPAEIPFIRL